MVFEFEVVQRRHKLPVEEVFHRIGTLNANWFRCFPPGMLLCVRAKGRDVNKRMRVIWFYRLRSIRNWWFCFKHKIQTYKRTKFAG